jgi:hypothetical protein
MFISSDTEGNTLKFLLTFDFKYIDNLVMNKIDLMRSIASSININQESSFTSSLGETISSTYKIIRFKIFGLTTLILFGIAIFIRIEGSILWRLTKVFSMGILIFLLTLILKYYEQLSFTI